MAVLKMQKISIVALKKERKSILEFLQRKGIVEIIEDNSLLEDSIFYRQDVSKSINVLERSVNLAEQALTILDEYNNVKPENLMLTGRKVITAKDYKDFSSNYDEAYEIVSKIVSYDRIIKEETASIYSMQSNIETLKAYESLDVPFDLTETKTCKAFVGCIPGNYLLDDILMKLNLDEEVPVHIEIIKSSSSLAKSDNPEILSQTYIFAITNKKDQEIVFNRLRSIGFSIASVLSDKAPKEAVEELNQKILSSKKEIESTKQKIKDLLPKRELVKMFLDYSILRTDKYRVLSTINQTQNIFIVEGFIPVKFVDEIKKELLDQFICDVEVKEIPFEEEEPVLLQNNGFASPVESTVESYSLPLKTEFDPTSAVAITYYMLFGLMLSDAAYGAIVAIACTFALMKFKNMENSTKKMVKMFLYCGISTVFWGVLFGSYFGDVVTVVTGTFFGKEVTLAPLWFEPINDPMRLLVFSLLIGTLHIFFGLFMKLRLCLMSKDYSTMVFDVLVWYGILTGLIILMLSSEAAVQIMGLNFILPASVGNIGKWLAIISAIGIIAGGFRKSKNPILAVFLGLYDLYNISGFFSDILSYSRLLALGLATGVIASVVNKMGSMPGNTFFGWILFIVVFCLGHVMNLLINILGAYVHTNRLQYVEFFGKFYEGGSKKFNPFSAKSVYHKFDEDKDVL